MIRGADHRRRAAGDPQRGTGRGVIRPPNGAWARMRFICSLLLVASVGCDQNVELYACLDPDAEGAGPCPPDPPDLFGLLACPGQCVQAAGGIWSSPSLVWLGPAEHAPDCPEEAPLYGFDGYSGLVAAPPVCGPCACELPEVTCVLPSLMTTSTSPCPGDAPGSTHVSFDAPEAWDGACSAGYAVAPGAMCNGEPCVASLTAEIPIAVSTACGVKSPPPPPPVKSSWISFVRACGGEYPQFCGSPGEMCAPKPLAPPPEGYDLCVHRPGDHPCPRGWSRRQIYHRSMGGDWSCSACDCSAPIGASCMAAVSVFSDSECSSMLDFHVVSSDDAALCRDLSIGVGLGSKSAEIVTSDPGACDPIGGIVVGEVEPIEPETFCCMD
jgi:hypothetical protein